MKVPRSDGVTTIDLLRHGSCEGGEIYRGRADVALSAEGWQQMEHAIKAPGEWHRVVTSPLVRCRAFAEHCADRFDLPVQVVADLQEISYGEWEGKLQQDVWRGYPDLVSRYYDSPETVTPPGGECTVDALQRVVSAWQALVAKNTGEHLLVVCHGGVIRLLLSHLLGMPLSATSRLNIPYASLSRVRVYPREGGDFPVLMSLNAGDALL